MKFSENKTPTDVKAEKVASGSIYNLDNKSVNAKFWTLQAKHRKCGSCGERPTCYHWEKQVSSGSVGVFFLKFDAEGAVRMDVYLHSQRGETKM